MNIPMSWLKEYVPLDCDIKTYIDAMTLSGTKVESYEELGAEIKKVVVGKIVSIQPHPDADKLVITNIDIGTETLQIVTGANNISEGDIVPVALHGSTLPGGIKIKKGKLRGIESNGMLCSVEELGFEPKDIPDAPEDGIYIFQEELPLGSDVKPFFGLDDIVVEYEITSNRPDCYSILGVAREAAATFKKTFQYPKIEVKENEEKIEDFAQIRIDNTGLCPRYAARVVKNVKINPSPKWMQKYLLASGIRPINNIVDITNYVMLEMGQPLHAFDLNKLAGDQIIVRNAREKETFVTLDEIERTLDASMLVIADGEKPVAIAGIMGGENSKVTEDTQTLLLESANFDGTNIRLTSKKLGLRTDASSKFEKGLDPNLVIEALNRAAQLIEQLGAGEIVGGILDSYPNPRKSLTISYDPESINRLLGTEISHEEMVDILKRIQCQVDPEKKIVIPPTFRSDLLIEADLAEEIARFYGYDRIPTTLATGTPTVGKETHKQKIEEMTRNVMEAQGFYESLSYSFESPKVFDWLLLSQDHPLRQGIRIANPLGEDFSVMRTTPLHGMLQCLSTNYNRRNEAVRLYELAKIYLAKSLPLQELPDERVQLTFGMYGEEDFYDAKGVVETFFERFHLTKQVEYISEHNLPWMHPGRCAAIHLDGEEVGYVGEIHPKVLKQYSIDSRVYIGVVDLPKVIDKATMERSYTPLPKFPAMVRDLALLVKEEIPVREIEKMIEQRGGKLLESYELFDVYQGEQVKIGHKSVAYSLLFRDKERTLTEEEINKIMKKILHGLETELEVRLRE